MSKRAVALWAMFFVAGPSGADEVDDLVKQLRPPARFAGHTPDFSLREQEFTFASPRGPVKEKWKVVRDGERCVVLYRSKAALYPLTHDPALAPRELVMPVRHHMVTQHAVYVTTTLWWGGCDRTNEEWSGGGKSLTLTYTQEWTPQGRHKCTAKSVRRHTLRFDPVTGYVIDIACELTTDEVPEEKGRKLEGLEFVNFFVSRLADPWPDRWRYDYTVYCPAPADKFGSARYAGWANNCVASDRSDDGRKVTPRTGGFVAFLADKQGWGPALTRTGDYTFELRTCNVWEDQHNHVHFPARPDGDGLYRLNPTFRLVWLPPEVTKHVLENLKVEDFGGGKAVMIRVGVLEDFEDQPLPMTTTIRGAYGHGLRVSSEQAHSGKKALVVKGEKDPNTRGPFLHVPQIPLDANTKYLLESWALVEGEGTEACVTGDLYEHSPHSKGRLVVQQTPSAKSGEGWKRLTLEFDTTPTRIDPFIDLRFRVVGPGRAYFDDFRLVKAP